MEDNLFDKLIKKASQPIKPLTQKDGRKPDDYTGKKTRSNKTEDTLEKRNRKSRESNASTETKNPR